MRKIAVILISLFLGACAKSSDSPAAAQSYSIVGVFEGPCSPLTASTSAKTGFRYTTTHLAALYIEYTDANCTTGRLASESIEYAYKVLNNEGPIFIIEYTVGTNPATYSLIKKTTAGIDSYKTITSYEDALLKSKTDWTADQYIARTEVK